MSLLEDLKKYEGFRANVYKCPVGKNTVGYGRNLDDVGLTHDEAEYLLINDINKCRKQLLGMSFYNSQPPEIKDAIVNMCFNMGLTKLLKFTRMINALIAKDYNLAAKEALQSLWAKQVGQRAVDIANIFKKYA